MLLLVAQYAACAFVLLVSSIIGLVSFISLRLWLKGTVASMKSVPKAPGHFILGSAVDDSLYLHRHLTKYRKTLGESQNFALWLAHIPVIVVQNPVDVQYILGSGQHHFHKSLTYQIGLKWFIGGSLLLVEDDVWRRSRRLLNPAFHFDVVAKMLPTMETVTEKLLTNVTWHAQNKKIMDMQMHIMNATQDVLGLTAFGFDFNCSAPLSSSSSSSSSPEIDYRTALNSCLAESMERLFRGLPHALSMLVPEFRRRSGRADVHKQVLVNAIKEAISEAKKKKTKSEEKKKNILTFLMEAQEAGEDKISDEDLIHQMLLFLFAGTDTTGFLVSAVLHLLSLPAHKEFLTTLLSEIDRYASSSSSSSSPFTADVVLNKMPFLNAVIRETLRLWPSAPVVGRSYKEEKGNIVLPSGVVVDKNIVLWISPYLMHRNTKIWGPSANEFNPLRWLQVHAHEFTQAQCPHQDETLSISTAFIPFVAGQRNCIGQNVARLEASYLVVRLLSNYTFQRPDEGAANEEKDITMTAAFLFKDGLHLIPTPRQ